ncbi:unnamed protein product [Soboliphyme baturini]|uniref:Bestrophin homolog n=1 Tax=Soboliphyme baturini TaxID=241478 RepID=A0A183IFU1_9BILA|nr:unnamed protein product [Soboliphyme baturini]
MVRFYCADTLRQNFIRRYLLLGFDPVSLKSPNRVELHSEIPIVRNAVVEVTPEQVALLPAVNDEDLFY